MIDFLDILVLIVVAISAILLGGFIYLVYLPFKRRLLKSGKLSTERNRKINFFFIVSVCILFFSIVIIGLFFSDFGRTSSNNRLEKKCDVKLPTEFKVLKDEYHDMMQDYCILYDIQFDKNSTKEFIKSIRKSKFYNAKSFHKGVWKEDDFILIDSIKAVWCSSPNGFDFNRDDGLTTYYIELDTITNILKYNECAD
ncbi:MAG: hypothetical protein V4667_05345 [Bacteroidota bacterium]